MMIDGQMGTETGSCSDTEVERKADIKRKKNVTSKWKMNSGIRWNQKARKRVTGRQKERERNHQHIFPHMNAPYCISDIVF